MQIKNRFQSRLPHHEMLTAQVRKVVLSFLYLKSLFVHYLQVQYVLRKTREWFVLGTGYAYVTMRVQFRMFEYKLL